MLLLVSSTGTTLPFFNHVFVAKGTSFLVILTEEKLASKVQNRKKMFMAVPFVVSGGKAI
jgi:hypothetical protein